MTSIDTAYGPGRIVATENYGLGKKRYRVAGVGFDVWMDGQEISKTAGNPRDRAGDSWAESRDKGRKQHEQQDLDDDYPAEIQDPDFFYDHRSSHEWSPSGYSTGPEGRALDYGHGDIEHLAAQSFDFEPSNHTWDNHTTLPYNWRPQFPVEMFRDENTISPDHEIDAEERLRSSDSRTGESREEDHPYPGPAKHLFAAWDDPTPGYELPPEHRAPGGHGVREHVHHEAPLDSTHPGLIDPESGERFARMHEDPAHPQYGPGSPPLAHPPELEYDNPGDPNSPATLKRDHSHNNYVPGEGRHNRAAGLDDRYADIMPIVAHNDPVWQFQQDPDGTINRHAAIDLSAGLDHETGLDQEDHVRYASKQLKEAKWRDVAQKAYRIKREGGVHVHAMDPSAIYATVAGDHGDYEVMILRGSAYSGLSPTGMKKQAIANWKCSCDWGKWAFKRKFTFVGRLCSHGYAAYLTQQGEHMADQHRRRKTAAEDAPKSSSLEGFKKFIKDENDDHIDFDAADLYLQSLEEEPDRDDAQAIYNYVLDHHTEREPRDYDVKGYDYDNDGVLQNKPGKLNPHSVEVPELSDEDHHYFTDLGDDRKTTGPEQIMARVAKGEDSIQGHHPGMAPCYEGDDGESDIVHFSSRVFTSDENQLQHLRDLSQEPPDLGNMAAHNEEVRNTVEDLRERGFDASPMVASLHRAALWHTAAPGDPGDPSNDDDPNDPNNDLKHPGQLSNPPGVTTNPAGGKSLTTPGGNTFPTGVTPGTTPGDGPPTPAGNAGAVAPTPHPAAPAATAPAATPKPDANGVGTGVPTHLPASAGGIHLPGESTTNDPNGGVTHNPESTAPVPMGPYAPGGGAGQHDQAAGAPTKIVTDMGGGKSSISNGIAGQPVAPTPGAAAGGGGGGGGGGGTPGRALPESFSHLPNLGPSGAAGQHFQDAFKNPGHALGDIGAGTVRGLSDIGAAGGDIAGGALKDMGHSLSQGAGAIKNLFTPTSAKHFAMQYFAAEGDGTSSNQDDTSDKKNSGGTGSAPDSPSNYKAPNAPGNPNPLHPGRSEVGPGQAPAPNPGALNNLAPPVAGAPTGPVGPGGTGNDNPGGTMPGAPGGQKRQQDQAQGGGPGGNMGGLGQFGQGLQQAMGMAAPLMGLGESALGGLGGLGGGLMSGLGNLLHLGSTDAERYASLYFEGDNSLRSVDGGDWMDYPFAGSGPLRKDFSTTSEQYVEQNERTNRHDNWATDNDGDLIKDWKPAQRPKQSSRRVADAGTGDAGYGNPGPVSGGAVVPAPSGEGGSVEPAAGGMGATPTMGDLSGMSTASRNFWADVEMTAGPHANSPTGYFSQGLHGGPGYDKGDYGIGEEFDQDKGEQGGEPQEEHGHGGPGLAEVAEKALPLVAEASLYDGSDIVRQFQASGGGALAAGSGSGQFGDDAIAKQAQRLLKTAGRHYSLAEQRELEDEGRPRAARNLGSLQLGGTHYEG